jgi:hypothetical protein
MTTATQSNRLSGVAPAFCLSAAVTVIFNTALAWAKDAYAPLNNFMKSLTGHHWTTHGLADLILFFGLGFIFMKTGMAEKMDPNRLNSILIGSVIVAGLGLALWFALF